MQFKIVLQKLLENYAKFIWKVNEILLKILAIYRRTNFKTVYQTWEKTC